MEITPLTQNPFAALTFVAAPALLTNASSVLAMSTINRMLRTRDRMHELLKQSEAGAQSEGDLWLHVMAWLGAGLGIAGVGGLVFGCVNLFHATRLTIVNIHEEASLVRERFAPLMKAGMADD